MSAPEDVRCAVRDYGDLWIDSDIPYIDMSLLMVWEGTLICAWWDKAHNSGRKTVQRAYEVKQRILDWQTDVLRAEEEEESQIDYRTQQEEQRSLDYDNDD